MTIEEAVKKMKDLSEVDDEEVAHAEADRILCEMLINVGYVELVEAWDKIHKFYS